jgi:type I restriction enzyme M protein
MIVLSGWKAKPERILIENKKKQMVDKGWKCDILPKEIVIKKYFDKELVIVNKMTSDLEEINQKKNFLEEENSEEEDLLAEVRNEKDKITKKILNKRIKEINHDSEFSDELKAIEEYLSLIEKEADLKKKIKDIECTLDKELHRKYHSFTEDELKELIVDDKWLASLKNAVHNEMHRISQKLAGRIKELAERYEAPLPILMNDVTDLSKKVGEHLQKMGYRW